MVLAQYLKMKSQMLKKEVEHRRIHAGMKRKKISETSRELFAFCEQKKPKDALVTGIVVHNPFQEKKSCAVL